MKIGPLLRAFEVNRIPALLIHTGQHYDAEMSDRFFTDLNLPAPDVKLGVGSASHAIQTAEIMRRFEPVVDETRPAAVLVVGDVNSTIACALVAVKKSVPVIHVEAGLRSYDRSMPEEINRVLTDQISNVLYTTERSACANLEREGIDVDRIHFVGNVMIDSLRHARERAIPARTTMRGAGINPTFFDDPNGYGLVTLHRPSNVDERETLETLLSVLARVAERLPLMFALHPRTRRNITQFGLDAVLAPRVVTIPPQGYLEMLGLMADAQLVLTDSGGMQEETTALAVPCLTLRENTERPITIEQGTNTLVGRDPERILRAVDEILTAGGKRGRMPELWDGKAAERIAAHLAGWLNEPEATKNLCSRRGALAGAR
jgi:UDP-N-acetylglucosamine 2-epimerase (non-hydrolysing)